MRLLSWDIGLYNLAYCILEGEQIVDWAVLNVVDPEFENVSKMACSAVLKNKKPCKGKVKYCTDVPEKKHYCRRHKTEESRLIQKIKYTPKNALDIHKTIIRTLDAIPALLQVDRVIIENQPSLSNPKMKTIQNIIYSYFLIRGVIDYDSNHVVDDATRVDTATRVDNNATIVDNAETQTTNKIKGVYAYSARNKMNVYTGPPIDCKIKSKYGRRKFLAKRYCEHMVAGDAIWSQFYKEHTKKQDDLADCYLQGMYYIRNA